MILGMSTAAFTTLHVLISLIGIASGLVVLAGMWSGRTCRRWTAVFLVFTVLTSLTGFLFPSAIFGAPHAIGVVSLIVLAVTVTAFYYFRLAGSWRSVYVCGAVLALYLNVFVGVVQAFLKIGPLRALAPTGKEPAFLITQLLVLAAFIGAGVAAARRFKRAVPPTFA